MSQIGKATVSFEPSVYPFGVRTMNGKDGAPEWVCSMLNSVGYRTYDLGGLSFDWRWEVTNSVTLLVEKRVRSTVADDFVSVRFAEFVNVHPDLRFDTRQKLREGVAKVFALALLHELDEQLVIEGKMAFCAHAPGRVEAISLIAERYSKDLTPSEIPYTFSSLNHEDITKLADTWRSK